MSALLKEYTDIEFLSDLNEIVSEKPTASQRDIGEGVGISVAVVNALLKRCLERGWLAVNRIDGRKLRYMLTDEGISTLTKRSIAFMRRNFKELAFYKENIENHITKAKANGKSRVVLYGKTSIDFLIEESCRSHLMEYQQKKYSETPSPEEVAKEELAVIGEEEKESIELIGAEGQVQTVFALAGESISR